MELSGHVVVSVPTRNCTEYLYQAVGSVLSQTYEDLEVIVVSDGDDDGPWEALASIGDPRLKRARLASSRGPYFIHDIVLRSATDAQWLLIQDADDWSEECRVANLLTELMRRPLVGVTSGQFYEGLYQSYATTFCAPLRPDWYFDRARHHGLYSREGLLAAGGYFGGTAYAFDSFIVNSLYVCNALGYIDVPLYHRRRRAGSLSRSKATGVGSPARADYIERLVHAWRELLAHAESLSCGESLLPAVAQLVDSLVTPSQRAERDRAVSQLREGMAAGLRPSDVVEIGLEQ